MLQQNTALQERQHNCTCNGIKIMFCSPAPNKALMYLCIHGYGYLCEKDSNGRPCEPWKTTHGPIWN